MVDAVSTLRGGAVGARTAALVEVFNELAPVDIPPSEELEAMITMTLSERAINPEDYPLYALVTEYLDAFITYVKALDNMSGLPLDSDSLEFAMERYGSPISEASSENPNVIAYITLQLETPGG
jgi:hypothetical protein